MKTNIKISILISLAILCGIILLSILWSNYTYSLQYLNLMEYEKTNYGGVIFNNTAHPIKIIASGQTYSLEPKKSSKEIGISDFDFLIIERPTMLEGQIYNNGTIKFRDFSSIEIYSEDNIDKIKPSIASKIIKKLIEHD